VLLIWSLVSIWFWLVPTSHDLVHLTPQPHM